ncbi:MAG TPA: phage head-tail connector protein [Actinophytocola sp.]|jgi:hypothetical protein|nr:phage head-tail connector protein [Actinophytocola sp.]
MWPPELTELKVDMKIDPDDERDDERLQQTLDAAVSFVESVRTRINYTEDPLSTRPEPGADLVLGTLRLAGRWHTRRDSPDGLVSMGELGSGRVPSIDPDIEKLLRIGRWAKAVLG